MVTLTITVPAPAKINLSLRIVGRRDDGYHLLESVMAPVSLCDRIGIRFTPGHRTGAHPAVSLRVSGIAVPQGPDNLACRAAALFLRSAWPGGAAEVRLTKRIPVGSGLGGGSSDAASVLLALNRLLGKPLPNATLCTLGARLGADVPFFLHGAPAWVRGIGEQVTPLNRLPPLHLVLCSDGYQLATAAVYAEADRSLTSAGCASNIPPFAGDRLSISEMLVNDLEAAAARIHPAVLALKAKLMDEGASGTLMAGSGSAVFGILPNRRAAATVARRLRKQGLWAEAVQTLPLSAAVGA